MDLDYRDVLRVIFWTWLGLSVFLLIRRRRSNDSAAPFEALPLPTSTSLDLPLKTLLDQTSISPGPTAPASESVPPVEERPLDPISLDGNETMDPATPGAWGRPSPIDDEAEATTIFDPPTPTSSSASNIPPSGTRRIADLLEGISLPADLVPFVDSERPIGARESVAFYTIGFEAGAVGAAMGTELRRLGFDLEAAETTRAIARRGGETLHVAVFADAAVVERGDRKAFPGALPGAVVVEVWTD